MPKVAFVCVENAGRSQMAAAFARRANRPGLTVVSGGTLPAPRLNPMVVEAMREAGIDLSREVPRGLSAAELADCDYVITMGCAAGEVCPATFRGDAIDWALPDPKGKSLEEVRRIRDEIERRVKAFVEEMGA